MPIKCRAGVTIPMLHPTYGDFRACAWPPDPRRFATLLSKSNQNGAPPRERMPRSGIGSPESDNRMLRPTELGASRFTSSQLTASPWVGSRSRSTKVRWIAAAW